MSIISRIFSKTPPATDGPADGKEQPAVASPPPPDPEVRAREEEAIVSQAIAAGDMVAVGQWVLDGSSTRIRQLAARSISEPDQLRDLVRATRHGNDKTVHRILATRRDELLAEVRRIEQRQAEVDTTAAAIARHAERHPVTAHGAGDPAGDLAVRLEERLRAAVRLRAPHVLEPGELGVGPRVVERDELPAG